MQYCFRAWSRLAVVLCFFVIGCGEAGPQFPKCYPVSGTVLIDGTPAVRALVGLHPLAPQAEGKKYGGSTFTDDNGAFQMTTFAAGDGVPTGDYVVTIVAEWVSENGEDVAVPDLLGGEYATPEVSTLKVSVKEEPVELEPYLLKKSESAETGN